MQNVIITLVGKDQPGLVETVSTYVYQAKGNWLSSNLSKMAGQFAGIVQVQLPNDKIQVVEEQIASLAHLQCVIKVDDSVHSDEQLSQISVDVMGNDKPGIVQEISAALAQSGASVVKMETSCEPAPNWGGNLFKAHITATIDSKIEVDHVTEQLEAIANDLVVELEVAH